MTDAGSGRSLISVIASISLCSVAASLTAPGDDARFSKQLEWKKPRFSRVLALGYTDLGANGRGGAEVRTIGDRSCVVGTTVGFDVDDRYAFDVDERVDLTLTYAPELTTAQAIVVLFDKSGGDSSKWATSWTRRFAPFLQKGRR
jgi:hypothetical protein